MEKKKLTACAIVIGCFLLFGVLVSANQGKKYEKQFFAMDTIMNLKIYDKNKKHAIKMLSAAQSEIERLDQLLSTGNSESEVSRLNREKTLTVSSDCHFLMCKSSEIHQMTQGAFDITVYPVMKAWGFADASYHVPDQELLRELLQHVNMSDITFDLQNSYIALPDGVMIDFGGIAKGYTSACVISLLKSQGVEHALLDLGGNIHALGTKPDGRSWSVAIRFPQDYQGEKQDYLGILEISDQAAITSGGYERYFEENGVRYHHIIDPHTGMPAQSGLLSVTIVSEDSALADGLSTSCYVAGVEEAIRIWESRKTDFDMILFTETGDLYITKGLEDLFRTELDFKVIQSVDEAN